MSTRKLSLFIYKADIATVSNLSALEEIGEGFKSPTRHGGNLRSPGHRIAHYESEPTNDGIQLFFDTLSLDIKKAMEKSSK